MKTGAPKRKTTIRVWSGFVIVVFVCVGASRFSHAKRDARYPLEAVDTSSPRATLTSYLDTFKQIGRMVRRVDLGSNKEKAEARSPKWRQEIEGLLKDVERMLDLSNVPSTARKKAAEETGVLLYEILARIEIPPKHQIPDASAFEELEPGDKAQWTIPHTEITIARVEKGPRQGEFLFSPATVDRASEFYSRVQSLSRRRTVSRRDLSQLRLEQSGPLMPLDFLELSPPWMVNVVEGQVVWKWIALALLFMLLIATVTLLGRWLKTPPKRSVWVLTRRLFTPLLFMGICSGIAYFANDQVRVTGLGAILTATVFPAFNYLMLSWVAATSVSLVAELYLASHSIHGTRMDGRLIRLLAYIGGIAAGTVVIFYGAERLGVPLYGVIAGLGVGGLAVALSAQSTVENFIGGLNIYVDHPVRVGDFCRYGDDIGTIEEIGLRSTRIRGLDRTVSSVPNGNFANMKITNYTVRDRLLLRTNLLLRLDTSTDQLRFLLAKLRELLFGHPKVINEENPRIRFIGYGESALVLEIFAYVATTDYADFLAIQEDVLMRAKLIVEDAGAAFAVPAQTLYISRERGSDGTQRDAVEAQVKAWRAEKALPFPNHTEDQISEFADSLDYPPKGSPESADDDTSEARS